MDTERVDIAADLAQIHEQGWVKLPRVFPPDEVRELKELTVFHHAEATKKIDASTTPFLNRGHDNLYNLQNKDFRFLRPVLRTPHLTALLKACLNDEWYKQIPASEPNYIMRSYGARSSGPEPMPLHLDSYVPSSGRYIWSLQMAIILDRQTPENGCTIVVPGSHRSDRYAPQEAVAQAIPVPSEPGDLVIWDSRLWHAATGNHSHASRWSLLATFVRWWIKPLWDIPATLPQEIYDQLTDSERAIMGFCSRSPANEFERIDIKTGYESLPRIVPSAAGRREP